MNNNYNTQYSVDPVTAVTVQPSASPSYSQNPYTTQAQAPSLISPMAGALGMIAPVNRLYLEDLTVGTDLPYYSNFKNIVDSSGLRLFTLLFNTMITGGGVQNIGGNAMTTQGQRRVYLTSMTLVDANGLPLITASRNLDEPCCDLLFDIHSAADGKRLGDFGTRCCCSDSYRLRAEDLTGSSDLSCVMIPKKCCHLGSVCCCCIPAFKIQDKRGPTTPLGEMRPNWPEKPGVFGISFAPGVSALQKMMLITCGVQINYRHFYTVCGCSAGTLGYGRILVWTDYSVIGTMLLIFAIYFLRNVF